MMTKPAKKIQVTQTLRDLQKGERVVFPLAEVNESSVRSRCSQVGRANNYHYMIERKFPNLLITRVI